MLTHFDEEGRAHMVSVTDKADTERIAVAKGKVLMSQATLEVVRSGGNKKGDVLSVAQIAGIMGAKKTSDVIPMCHPLLLTGVDIAFILVEDGVEIEATVKTIGKTGVEMEALTAVSMAGLTIYDMCKAMDKEMVITDVRLMKKMGGKSGTFTRA